MLSALQFTYLMSWAMSDWMHRDREPWRCKKKRNTFSSTKLLTQVTVADKLVFVNPFWLNNHFVHCLMHCLFAVSCWFVQPPSLTVNINLSDVTNKYYTVPYRTVAKCRIGIWEKESIIGVQRNQKNPEPWIHHSVRNLASLVSHWNNWPLGWDYSVPTGHQWWILFIPPSLMIDSSI